jgi:hypothetical protein
MCSDKGTVLGGFPIPPDCLPATVLGLKRGISSMRAFRALMGIAVLGCVFASTTFAFEFGWTRGATEVHHWTYALVGVALDLFKSGLPILGAMAWHDSKPARSGACWIVFTVLTGLSLWCAYGTTATQLAEKFANQAVASTTQAQKQGKLDRLLEDKRKQLPYTVSSEEVVRLWMVSRTSD